MRSGGSLGALSPVWSVEQCLYCSTVLRGALLRAGPTAVESVQLCDSTVQIQAQSSRVGWHMDLVHCFYRVSAPSLAPHT